MTRIAIVTDSTSDLPRDLADQRSISVVPLTVSLDGESFLDGVEIKPDEFYERLAASRSAATTSQPSPGLFAETYERLLRSHDEVVSIHISEKLSGTLAAARQGAVLVDSSRIHVVDSELVSMPLSLLTLVASRLADQDEPAAAILSRLREVGSACRTFFTVSTLEYLRRGGRIGHARAFLGSVLQLKPLLTIREGEVAPLEKVRTHERSLTKLIELARAVDTGHGLCLIVGHAAREDSAQRLARTLEPVCESVMVQQLGPVVGAHAGPGTVGLGCYPAQLFQLGLKRLAAAATL
jgi:DegV family protein with EDD domain